MTTALAFLASTPLIACWAACFWLARELAARGQLDGDWRLSWAWASLGFGVVLTAIVETASVARMLTPPVVLSGWLLADALLFGLAATLARRRGMFSRTAIRAWLGKARGSEWGSWPLDVKLMAATVLLLVAGLFLIAVVTTTTNWDSLTYHLPRALHWLQQQSVEHYPTNNSRQLEFAPWSSFVQANLFLLTGGDRLANLVQWFAMLSGLLVLGSLARQLLFITGRTFSPDGVSPSGFSEKRLTWLTALVAVTLPIGLVESITTQNDYVTAFWLICLFCFIACLVREPNHLGHQVGASTALALGALTKATTYLFAAPLLAVAGVWLPWQLPGARWRLRLIAVFVAVFALLNGPHAWRNWQVFGSPLGSKYIFTIERNARFSAGGLISNAIRNLSLDLNTPIPAATDGIFAALQKAHSLTGIDLNDPETTYHVGRFSFPKRFFVYDSYAPGPCHVLLIALALGMLCLRPRRDATLLAYGAVILASALLFCGYLRWQQWHMRSHLAYFLLLTPLAALVLVQRFPRWAQGLTTTVLVLFAAYTMARNQSRPVFNAGFLQMPRELQYFAMHGRDLAEPLQCLAQTIAASDCRCLGLKLDFDEAEYPLWVMLRNRGFSGRLRHCGVDGEVGQLTTDSSLPELLVMQSCEPTEFVRQSFPHVTSYGPFRLFSTKALTPGLSSINP